MSRTHRRKNYEAENPDRFGRRLFNPSEGDWSYYRDEEGRLCIKVHKKSEKEIIRQRLFRHGDNHSGVFSVPSHYCRTIEKSLRTHNKRELQKFVDKEDYEPMCISKYNGAGWSWW